MTSLFFAAAEVARFESIFSFLASAEYCEKLESSLFDSDDGGVSSSGGSEAAGGRVESGGDRDGDGDGDRDGDLRLRLALRLVPGLLGIDSVSRLFLELLTLLADAALLLFRAGAGAGDSFSSLRVVVPDSLSSSRLSLELLLLADALLLLREGTGDSSSFFFVVASSFSSSGSDATGDDLDVMGEPHSPPSSSPAEEAGEPNGRSSSGGVGGARS